MPKPWATLGVDLHLEPSGPGLRRGLTAALREAVRTGRLAPGTRLPSSRALAADLGVARNTVADAYVDLVAEGWLTARQGSGTSVATGLPAPPPGLWGSPPPGPSRSSPASRERGSGASGSRGRSASVSRERPVSGARERPVSGAWGTPAPGSVGGSVSGARGTPASGEWENPALGSPAFGSRGTPASGSVGSGASGSRGHSASGPWASPSARSSAGPAPGGQPPGGRPPSRPAYDLVPGSPDLSAFPRTAWLKAARRALAVAPYDALGYGDPRGRVELRTALAGYLARARGVRTHPDGIVICSGFAHGLMLLGQVLRERGLTTLAVESYGLDAHWQLLERAGLRTMPLGLDELGTRTDEVGAEERAVLLTPAHQFPMGGALHPDRRAAVVDWARRGDGLIVEDDYDGEFRYDRRPVGALQGLDPDHVVYLGTASKSLAPGLRLGWLVVPPSLAAEVVAAKGGVDWSCGVLDQLTLAEFITSGAYDRHVRSARLHYRRRRDTLVAALARRAPHIHATGIAAGLHVVLRLPPGTEPAALRAAAWQGLAVHGLHRYRHPEATVERPDALVVGYGTPPDHAWSAALDALCAALPE